jgi:Cu(I)/Ag(I) efflux system membrane protein CusA/SilA
VGTVLVRRDLARVVLLAVVIVGVWAYRAELTTPIDAAPGAPGTQLTVFADWPGRSPQEIEEQVVHPLTVGLRRLPGVRRVRASSALGFAMIHVVFDDDVDLPAARSGVVERLRVLMRALPAGVVPTVGPPSGAGYVRFEPWRTPAARGAATG